MRKLIRILEGCVNVIYRPLKNSCYHTIFVDFVRKLDEFPALKSEAIKILFCLWPLAEPYLFNVVFPDGHSNSSPVKLGKINLSIKWSHLLYLSFWKIDLRLNQIKLIWRQTPLPLIQQVTVHFLYTFCTLSDSLKSQQTQAISSFLKAQLNIRT